MGLSSALATVMSGLRANQAALSIVSGNIANAQTPGYVTQTPNQIELPSGSTGSNVAVNGVNRQLDLYIQSQLRTETSGGAYADQTANILGQLQSVYGPPGGDGTLETSYSNFTTALQALSTSQGSQSAQTAALAAAQSLAQSLNATSQGIQTLRSNVEQDIGSSVTQANADMSQIATINTRLQGLAPTDPAAATLMDQRDSAISDLAKLMDVRTVTDASNETSVFTTAGVQLVGGELASKISFSSPGALTANSLYNTDPAKSGVGSLTIQLPNGASFDMVANNSISSGQIAADLKLRDQTLVQAQNQVDQLAATMSSALSDTTTAGSPVTGPPAGFSVDTSNISPGNSISLTVTNTGTLAQQQIQIVNVTDPTALPLQNLPNASPKMIGIDFSGSMSSIVGQLNTTFAGSGVVFSNPSGTTLKIVGSAATVVNAASTTTTATSLTGGSAQLPLFTDGNALFTGTITGVGAQMTGYAGRITVNPALVNNPANFTVYSNSPATAAGDTTRSDFLYSQLTTGSFTYSPQTGLGSTASLFSGTITGFMQQFLSQQANAATTATQLQQGQDVVVSTLQQKFNSVASVSIDTEMSNLIALQNAYAANAHVMSVVQSMMTTLIQAQL
ncbi:MAG: flagellar hook-associated protein FlgK [Bradyrhizobium sp.]|uniref:flagellar hook-associated protein FlgK n=1 Tax=Bradyrhizobium sp. TaxID=376 RepID=UPI001C289FB4|nr:flagellar hook-associated protein FlgK [Bradyrhizobium sp.]MBU6461491.1 flagellar hook-associated protein FlgK [Pseudomonadota bacterium]MDE2066296.1 flagellar hook-associated protein FlgK [Bradyrhizobium sp.]MDE2242444.1 flagellar hook-associated protein FlgK [Bradyrhizobium sp.]MDE2471337.1 flagellar hook-associated protein FlgK [Bradyrhizobium sp.]